MITVLYQIHKLLCKWLYPHSSHVIIWIKLFNNHLSIAWIFIDAHALKRILCENITYVGKSQDHLSLCWDPDSSKECTLHNYDPEYYESNHHIHHQRLVQCPHRLVDQSDTLMHDYCSCILCERKLWVVYDKYNKTDLILKFTWLNLYF